MKKKITIILLTVLNFGIFPIKVFADENSGLCGILPCNVASPCLGADCNGSSLSVVGSILEILLSLIFVGIVIYGIWLIIQAAFKIVRSNGDEEQIQSGYKLIKGSYTGLILIFVGIIGLVIVFVLFNATDIFKISTPETPPGIDLDTNS